MNDKTCFEFVIEFVIESSFDELNRHALASHRPPGEIGGARSTAKKSAESYWQTQTKKTNIYIYLDKSIFMWKLHSNIGALKNVLKRLWMQYAILQGRQYSEVCPYIVAFADAPGIR